MEININGNAYRLAKLSVFDQLKVSRKLLPLLAGMVGELKGLDGSKAIETLLPSIADAVAGLSDDDCNAIIYPCLSVTARHHGKAWMPVFAQGELMFDDIDLPAMLKLVAQVIGDSLGSFLPGSPTSATAVPPAE